MARPVLIHGEAARIRYSVAEYLSENVPAATIRATLIERGWARTAAEADAYIREGRQANRLAQAIEVGNAAQIERLNAALPEGGTGRRVITAKVQIRPSDPDAVEPEGGWPWRTVRVLATARTPIVTAGERIDVIVENWNRQYGTRTNEILFLSVVEG